MSINEITIEPSTRFAGDSGSDCVRNYVVIVKVDDSVMHLYVDGDITLLDLMKKIGDELVERAKDRAKSLVEISAEPY